MKFHAFLIKYAEIAIKGNNRKYFEDALVKQIRFHLRRVEGEFTVTKTQGRVYVEAAGDYDTDEVIEELKRVFGILWICPVVRIEDHGFRDLSEKVVSYIGEAYPEKNLSFKCECRRTRKNFELNSQEMNAELGHDILEAYPEMHVDVHHPDVLLRVEVREDFINIYSKEIRGQGGMPLGTSGKAMLLLSGGIDSPVAGYRMLRRGMTIDAVYFHAYPYTSDEAREKVEHLAEILSHYGLRVHINTIPFTEVQMQIKKKSPENYTTLMLRLCMMKAANMLAQRIGASCLITGESLGQVASQTIENMSCTESMAEYPLLRPLVGTDKEEIVEIAKEIGTYETSILPYEDCCVLFSPRHPVLRSTVEEAQRIYKELEVDELVKEAFEKREIKLYEV